MSRHQYVRKYQRLVTLIVANSRGFTTPSKAVSVLQSVRESLCGWGDAVCCDYGKDAKDILREAIASRHRYYGTSEYAEARCQVRDALYGMD
jgi:hypothetical protein